MISILVREQKADLFTAIRQAPLLGVRIHSYHDVYGFDAHILIQYDGGSPTAALMGSKDGRWYAAAGPNSDLDELEAFFRSVPLRSLLSSSSLCERISDLGRYYTAPIMTYSREAVKQEQSTELWKSPSFEDVYGLLGKVNHRFCSESPWDEWYTHNSHLVRHGLGYVCGICREDQLVSTGSITAVGEHYALISNIATREEWRHKGLAAEVVRHLVNTSVAWSKTPCLFCANESLAGYYSSLGFLTSGRWCKVDRAQTRQ